MRLFKRYRSCPKSDPPTVTDDSQKSWGVFRLFQGSSGGAAMGKEPADAVATVCLDDESHVLKQPPDAGANSPVHRAPVHHSLTNQNYSPEVALSPEPWPLHPRQPAGSHNSGGDASASAENKEKEIARFELWQRRKPHFHFGPRQKDDETAGGDSERRDSAAGSNAGSENIITLPPKFAFICQDGKFVEREVTRWPKQQRAVPHLRYRVLEPYASHYGRRYSKRINSEERIVPQRHRLIYQNPIYRLPRKIMEENKSRLMTRHCLKNSFEGTKLGGGPQVVEVGEREQSKMIRKMAEKYHQKEAEKLVDYISIKSKAVKNS